MFKQYIKNIWASLKQDSVVTIINILGTALAIFLIMVVVLMQEVKVLPFSPESNRDLFLICNALTETSIGKENTSMTSGRMSEATAKELFSSLKNVKDVTLFSGGGGLSKLVSANKSIPMQAESAYTDDAFWRVFDFKFLSGKPFDNATFKAGQKVVVISESVARHLFHDVNVAGREIEMDFVPYRICGVVRDVSLIASQAYAQLWIPYTTSDIVKLTSGLNNVKLGGTFSAVILANSKSDFPKIKAQVNARVAAINSRIKADKVKLELKGRPMTQFESSITTWSNELPEPGKFYRKAAIILLILLLVPAINLSSMTQSRLRRYITEIGIRRAFGCPRSRLLSDIINENLVLSVIAGIVGLLFCVIFAYFASDMLFTSDWSGFFGHPTVSLSLLLNPKIFLFAFIFCFILNLMSTIIPALHASHTNIVNALNGRTR